MTDKPHNLHDLDPDDHDDDFPQRARILQFPHHPVSPDGFIKSRIVSGNNRSATLTFKVDPGEARQLEELVILYRDEGYKTVSDIIRHAVRDHTTRLLDSKVLDNRAMLDNSWAQLQMMLKQTTDQMLEAEWGEVLERESAYIRLCQIEGAKGEIRKSIRNMRQSILATHSEFWRGHWARELKQRWGEYM